MTHPRGRVCVIDDDASLRKAVSRLLENEGYEVETFPEAKAFLASASPDRGPACLLLDLQLPGVSGLELQKKLRQSDRPIPVVFISGHSDIPTSVLAMKEGAVDFLTKPFERKALLAAVAAALEKDRILRRRRNEQQVARKQMSRLTAREREVYAYVLTGQLNKQIALKLGISEKTVKVHRARVMEKMHANSVAQLVQRSQKVGRKAPSSRN